MFKKEFSAFLKSFKVNKTLLYFAIVEIILIAILAGSLFSWAALLSPKSGAVSTAYSTVSGAEDLIGLSILAGTVKSFFIMLVFLSVLLLLIILFAFSISRLLVWSKLFKKRFKAKIYMKFTLLNLCYFLIWIPLIIIFILPVYGMAGNLGSNSGVGVYTFLIYLNVFLYLLIAYFGLFAYKSFIEHKKIYKAISESFKHGFKAIPKLIFPFLLVLITFIIFNLVASGLSLLGIAGNVIAAILLLYIFSATRIYIISKMT